MKQKRKSALTQGEIQAIDHKPFIEPEVDARYYLQLPVDKFIINMSAPMKAGYGHFFFLELIQKLSQKYDQLYFLITTNEVDPNFEEDLLEKLDQPSLYGKVSYLKFGKELPDILKASDIFVSPYKAEGIFPSIILKAMATALPVISIQSKLSELVILDQVTGLLIQENDLDQAVAKLSTLIEDRALSSELGSNGQKRVIEHFSL
ncbi:glycosyltransferase [Belliella pelovolcani]|uniref:Glycosyl transferases group 1 n=1 Tax=Belliella pelovolcani TaxID=529505 RepID=A0A1N7KI24_9BACT|nr:glycosyltransferase [Belliella pelovolcani]SIS61144.1 Glycosyl transferases group 1 [Belliella pelovolcani]